MKTFRTCFTVSMVVLLLFASVALAQTQSTTTAPQKASSGSMGNMPMMQGNQSGGMMGNCPGSCMGAMGMGSMVTMMILTSLFLLAATFALFALGVFLLRRSRQPTTS